MKISANLHAFLDMLAVSEGTSTSPATKNDGYDVIVTGLDKKPEIFTDFSRHPFSGGRASKVINHRGLKSNASGRYQFMLRDYVHYRDLLRLPDFGPDSQDKWALQLIKEQRALPDIEAGNFAQAVHKCRNIWASLPGAGYGQPEHPIAMLQLAYLQAGGVLA
ncbi:MAG: glycoside hydrolase family 104 protein [Oxalobacteraceae bacterium]|nr:glycoside hydrolase family 104 protein [Oxalobacteraceae bacterium]